MAMLTDSDEGKPVVNRQGEKIGRVTSVEGDSAFVDPDPGITDTVKSKLGWEDVDADDYRLDSTEIDSVTDDEIRLK